MSMVRICPPRRQPRRPAAPVLRFPAVPDPCPCCGGRGLVFDDEDDAGRTCPACRGSGVEPPPVREMPACPECGSRDTFLFVSEGDPDEVICPDCLRYTVPVGA